VQAKGYGKGEVRTSKPCELASGAVELIA
jgi:hypothetical protein